MIRVSGPRAFQALERLAATTTISKAAPRMLVRAILTSPQGEILDDALVAKFIGPESFTGEDVVELHLHGSSFVAARVLEVLADQGVRQALPGEFSFRAVRNGKMTLAQAQAVADLINAANDGAVTLAIEKMGGSQNRLISLLATDLRQMAMLGEVGIDFADQDVDEVSLPALIPRVEKIVSSLLALERSYARGHRLQDGVSVVFVGIPNAGKSSFFNVLLGEDRSIVSDIAGTTRDVVREKLTLRGNTRTLTLRLEDTAGLREAADAVEKIGIERSRQAAKNADLVLFLADPTQSTQAALQEWHRLVAIVGPDLSKKAIGIVTKADLVPDEHLRVVIQELATLGLSSWTPVSSETGQGLELAIERLVEFCESWVHRDPGEVLLTRLDHQQAVAAALEHLRRAQSAPELDLFAADLRQALHALSPLIGDTLPDDILGKIFSDFCIGK